MKLITEAQELLKQIKQSAPREEAAVRKIAAFAAVHGGRAYLVGGCVRDALLGCGGHDLDVEVHGCLPEDLLSFLRANWHLHEVGSAFGVVKLEHLEMDVALPRKENCLGAGHRDFSIATDPFLGIPEASARRDFTMNAIYLDPLSGELTDPWKGIADLRDGVLRHISAHFIEDPLRVLRAMQFAARFGFSVAPETVQCCRGMSQEALPRERLAEEWEKLLLKGKKPSLGLSFLREAGWLSFYPELQALIGCRQNPQYHPEGDVWTHTLLALDAAAVLRSGEFFDDLVLMLSVLCHDFGKPVTTNTDPETGKITSFGHEHDGLPLVKTFLARLWNRPDLADQVCRLVDTHMRPIALLNDHASARAFRRLTLDAKRPDLLAKVVECDLRGTLCSEETLQFVIQFREKLQALAIEKEPPKPLILGRDLIARGCTPGPAFSPLLKACFEAQLDGVFSTHEDGLVFLEELLRK